MTHLLLHEVVECCEVMARCGEAKTPGKAMTRGGVWERRQGGVCVERSDQTL